MSAYQGYGSRQYASLFVKTAFENCSSKNVNLLRRKVKQIFRA